MASKLPPKPRQVGTMANGSPAGYQPGAPMGGARGPVGAMQGAPQGVQGLALDKYRDAMMRRLGAGGPQPTPQAAPAANPVTDVFKRRTSRRVLGRMGNADEHDYR